MSPLEVIMSAWDRAHPRGDPMERGFYRYTMLAALRDIAAAGFSLERVSSF